MSVYTIDPMSPGSSPFRIPVHDLLAQPGIRRPIEVAAPVEWSVGSTDVGPVVSARLTVEGAAGGVLVRGTASVDARLTCHRCLTEWDDQIEVEVMELMGVEDDPDGYPLRDGVADLEDMLRDALLLAVPLAPTCSPGCLGLCSVCGGDLNTGACAGHEPENDSPFAVLRELLEPQ